jgi:hypothetical protein
LLELGDDPALRSTKRPPLQLTLHYLVTAWAEEPQEAHRLLGELAFATMTHVEHRIDLQPVPAAVWAALGLAPRPAFVLTTPLRRERPQPPHKYVRFPLEVKGAPVISLQGIVVDAEGAPLAGASVDLPALQLSTRTDANGRFRFSTIPALPDTEQLRVRFKGRELDVRVERPTTGREPVRIQFDLFE